MKILCIYCCGGMGREIADLSARINKWDKICFVDDNVSEKYVDGFEVFSFDEILSRYPKEDLEFIVTAGEPAVREKLYTRLFEHQMNCTNIIYPEFVLSKTSTVGTGTIIHMGAIATVNVHIGVGCLINKHVVIGHDVTIGDYCILSPNVTVGGEVTVGNNVFFGSGAIIRNKVRIGDNAIIGMGAVVLSDVPPGAVMVGNPARFLRENTSNRVFSKEP